MTYGDLKRPPTWRLHLWVGFVTSKQIGGDLVGFVTSFSNKPTPVIWRLRNVGARRRSNGWHSGEPNGRNSAMGDSVFEKHWFIVPKPCSKLGTFFL